jgi:RNA recognition motif-containing protein
MYKVFIGNIPYNSKLEEFKNLFKDYEGIINIELIQNHTHTKNFGVITLNKETSILNDKIEFKGRILRITEYKIQNNENKKIHNIIYVKGIPKTKNREWLKMAFINYELNRYFIMTEFNTGHQTDIGVIYLKNSCDYEKLLELKNYNYDDIIMTLQVNIIKNENYNIKE